RLRLLMEKMREGEQAGEGSEDGRPFQHGEDGSQAHGHPVKARGSSIEGRMGRRYSLGIFTFAVHFPSLRTNVSFSFSLSGSVYSTVPWSPCTVTLSIVLVGSSWTISVSRNTRDLRNPRPLRSARSFPGSPRAFSFSFFSAALAFV